MFEKLSFSGYDLYQPFQEVDQWVFDFRNGQAFHGTFKEIVKFMVEELNFETSEIEEAVNCMVESNSNGCHFGMYKRFIYSFNKEISVNKQAG